MGPKASSECLHQLFAAHAARAPEAVAVSHGGNLLTYGELERRANRLAHHLRSLGVGPEVPVALCLPRSNDLVTAILGIFKAGGAYLPLDPTYPAERLSYMMEDAFADLETPVLVTRTPLPAALRVPPGVRVVGLGKLPDGDADRPPCVRVRGEHPAYVIYTSGSTGKPKGVVVTHRNVVGLLEVPSVAGEQVCPSGANGLARHRPQTAQLNWEIVVPCFDDLTPRLSRTACIA